VKKSKNYQASMRTNFLSIQSISDYIPKIKIISVFILLTFIISPIFAEPKINDAIKLSNDFKRKNLLGSLIYFEDKNKIFSINEIENSLNQNFSSWSTTSERELSFGFTKSAIWLHFKVENLASELDHLFLECNLATLDKIDIFYRDQNGEWVTETLGDIYPFQKRKLKYRTLVFQFPIKFQKESKIFLRLENKGPMKISVLLRSQENLITQMNSDQMVLGIYYGIMIVILMYNFILFFTIRDKTYLFYFLYVLNIALYQFFISGNAAQFIFNNAPDIANRAPNLVAQSLFVFGLLFTKYFLNTKFYAPKINLWLEILIGIAGVLFVIILFVGHDMNLMRVSNIFGLVLILSIIVSGVIVFREGYRPARYFLIGWSILLLAGFVQIMANLGSFNLTAEHVGQIGSLIEVMFLTFALGDRINTLGKDQHLHQEIITGSMNPKMNKKNGKSVRPLFVILQTDFSLTYQQAQICVALSEGKSRITISEELGISSNTLKKHLSEIYHKTINLTDNQTIPSQEKLQKLTIFLNEINQT